MTRSIITTRLDIAEKNAPWLPPVGERKNVSLNTLFDTRDAKNPDSRLRGGTAGMLYAWVSTTYAPTLGRYGSILAFGGGHTDGVSNSVHKYDIEARTWYRICGPDPIGASGSQRSQISDGGSVTSPYGWATDDHWTDDTKTAVIDGAVAATHTYGQIGWVPPGSVGNISGWLFLSPFHGWPHYVDLDNPSTGWRRLPAHFDGSNTYGYIVIDAKRKRVMSVGPKGGSTSPKMNGFYQLDTNTIQPIPKGLSTHYYYHVGFHDEIEDLYIVDQASNPTPTNPIAQYFRVLDPVTNATYKPRVQGTIPVLTTGNGTYEYIASEKRLYWWSGVDDILWMLTATGNPRTDPWEWSSQVFGGAPFVPRQNNPMYKRLHWVEELGSFFIAVRHDQPVQCWRVR